MLAKLWILEENKIISFIVALTFYILKISIIFIFVQLAYITF